MAELLNYKRAFFPKGKQRAFILESKADLGCTWTDFAALAKTSVRNLSGWRAEKNSMSLHAVQEICKKRCMKLPTTIVVRDAFWNASTAAKVGGKAIIKKYGKVGGNETYRKQKWHDWWRREGKYKQNSITHPQSFKKAHPSPRLAEFFGIMLGDGGMNTYQFTITLNTVTDKAYLKFVTELIENLFDVPVGIRILQGVAATRIFVSRVTLISYLNSLGLTKGNKITRQIDIPLWILHNDSYARACLRGLIDTDGCIILHRYRSKGSVYHYTKIGFTSRSQPLVDSVCTILSHLEIKHRVMKNGYDVRIEACKDVERYFRIVGTHNLKHLKRYKKINGEVPEWPKGAHC